MDNKIICTYHQSAAGIWSEFLFSSVWEQQWPGQTLVAMVLVSRLSWLVSQTFPDLSSYHAVPEFWQHSTKYLNNKNFSQEFSCSDVKQQTVINYLKNCFVITQIFKSHIWEVFVEGNSKFLKIFFDWNHYCHCVSFVWVSIDTNIVN